MKSLMGFCQVGFGIGGLVSLFQGRWLAMVLCWVGAFLVGLAGTRLIQNTEGISQGGRDAIGNIGAAIEQLRQGRYASAHGLASGAVTAFRVGGDRSLLVPALILNAVTYAAVGKMNDSRRLLPVARQRFSELPPEMAQDVIEMRQLVSVIEEQLSQVNPDPKGIISAFLEFNDKG